MIRDNPVSDEAARWLIVCDCTGHPERVGVVDVTASGEVRVSDTGRDGGAPSLTGANRRLQAAAPSERPELLRQLKAREISLPLVVSLLHRPCGLELKVSEARFGELLTAVSGHVEDHRVPLSVLCAVNGRLPGGATR